MKKKKELKKILENIKTKTELEIVESYLSEFDVGSQYVLAAPRDLQKKLFRQKKTTQSKLKKFRVFYQKDYCQLAKFSSQKWQHA